MQTTLKINGVDFTPYIMEGGMTQSPVLRQSRTVETIGGTLFKSEVEKRVIYVQLVEVRDSTLSRLMSGVTNLSTVEYDDIMGTRRTACFYVSVTSAVAKKVIGGNTYYNGVMLQMEEK